MRRIALSILLPLSVSGQLPSGPYSIKGTVRSTAGGEPVRNALVSLSGNLASPKDVGAYQPFHKSVISGPGGEFHFNGLPAGSYDCSAAKFDFMPAGMADGNPASIDISESRIEQVIQLNLAPYGVIRGKVVDQFDEPLEYVLIVVDTVSIWKGESARFETGRLRTDNLGQYYLTRVPPGRYYVKAAGRDGGTEIHVGTQRNDYLAWESFAPAYFGGARERGLANAIAVTGGATTSADFRVELQPAFKIRGKIEGYRKNEPVEFQLLEGNEPGQPQRAVLDGVSGAFEIESVLPGTYTLRATQGKTRGEVPVTVGAADLEGVSVTLAPPVTIGGSILPATDAQDHSRDVPLGCIAGLQDYRHHAAAYESGSLKVGEFAIPDVLPGEYRVEIQCTGGYLISASFGGVDLMNNPIVTVLSGPPPPILATIRQGGGSLKVKVGGESQSQNATLLLVPSFPTLTGPLSARTNSLLGPPDANSFVWLAPGEYSLYLLSGDDVEYRNVAFLQSLSGGAKVRIEDRKTAEATIERVPK
jgi:hypothetical protein